MIVKFLIILVSFTTLTHAQSINLQIGQVYEHWIHTANMSDSEAMVYESFELTLDTKIPDQDLVFIVKGLTPQSDPDIFISTKHKNPENFNDSEYFCSSFGTDVCVIPAQDVKANFPYYFSIACVNSCRFQVSVVYEKEITMGINDFRKFEFKDKDSAEIIRIGTNNIDDSIHNLLITVSVINMLDLEEPIKVLLNKGQKIPQSEIFDISASDVWTGDKIISLERDSITNTKLESGIYTMLIQASKGSQIQIVTKAYGKVRDINLFENIEDTVILDSIKYYKLDLSKSEEYLYLHNRSNLVFQLTPYSGRPDLYVNPQNQTTLLDNYEWSNQEGSKEAIVVSQLQTNNPLVYYIAIFGGEISSTYSFSVLAETSRNTKIQLNEPVQGSMIRDEIQNFKFVVQGQTPRNITIELWEYLGHTALVLKLCGSQKNMPNCQVTQDDIVSRKVKESYEADKLFRFDDSPGSITLQFEYNPDQCDKTKSQAPKFCLYNVAIYTIPEENEKKTSLPLRYEYDLIVKSKHEYIILKENAAQKDFIQMHESNYYKFTVPAGQEALSVSFILTPLQGDSSLYISKTVLQPSIYTFDKESILNVARFDNDEDGPLNGTYYITAYGWSSGLYMITPIIVRSFKDYRHSGAFPYQYVQLQEGTYQTGELQDGKAFFKVDLSRYILFDAIKQNITISINPDGIDNQNNFIICASDKPEKDMKKLGVCTTPGQQSYKLTTNQNYPEILYLHVYPILQNTTKIFQIIYKTDESPIKILYLSSSSILSIKKGTYHRYKLQLQENQQVFLTKSVFSNYPSDVLVFISKDEKNTFPNEESNDGQVVGGKQITIDPKDVVGCQGSSVSNSCYIYFTAFASQDSFYTLKATQGEFIERLYEGEAQTVYLNSTKLSQDFKFYYIPTSNQEISILLTSQLKDVNIYVTLIKQDQKIIMNKDAYPTYVDNQYKVENHQQSYLIGTSLIIGAEDLKYRECSLNKCVVLITVFQLAGWVAPLKDQYFSIIVSTDVIKMLPSMTYTNHLSDKSIQYYQFTVPDQNATIIISMTPLSDATPEMVVSLGVNERPTPVNYDWETKYSMNDQLVIQLGSHPKVTNSTQGIYMYHIIINFSVGLYASSNCTYSLQYSIAGFAYTQLTKGIPSSGSTQKGKIQFYDFINYEKISFKFLLSVESGKAIIYGTTYKLDGELTQKVLDPMSSYPFTNKGQGNQEMLVIDKNDKHYCTDCHFLVAVMAIQNSEYSITVSDQLTTIILQNNKILGDFVVNNEINKYRFYGTKDFQLSVTLFSGEVKITVMSPDHSTTSDILKVTNQQTFYQKSVSFPDKVNQSRIFNHACSFFIQGNANSNYTIQCTTKAEAQKIKIGKTEKVVLLPEQQQEFVFTLSQDAPNLAVSLLSYGVKNINKNPTVTLLRELNQTKIVGTTYQKKIISSDDQSLKIFEAYAGSHVLSLKNTGKESLIIFLTVSQNDNVILMHKTQVMDVQVVGVMKTWLIFVSQPATLLINAVSCTGRVNVYLNSDLEGLKNGNYQKEISNQHSKQVQGTLKVLQAGEVYLGTKAIYGENVNNVKESVYKINYEELPIDAVVPIDWFRPNFDWSLVWNIGSDGKFFITLQKLECKDKYDIIMIKISCISSLFADMLYTYTIYFRGSDDDNESQLDVCLLSEYDQHADYKLKKTMTYTPQEHRLLNEIKIPVDLDYDHGRPDRYMHFNVEAQVTIKEGNNEYPLNYFYTPNKFFDGGPKGSISLLVIGLLLFIIAAAGFGIIVLYRRNIMLKKNLNYELSDVRNIGRSQQSQPSVVEMRHHSLIEDSRV